MPLLANGTPLCPLFDRHEYRIDLATPDITHLASAIGITAGTYQLTMVIASTTLVNCLGMVAPPGLEPGLSALKGPRVNQLHHGAKLLRHCLKLASSNLEGDQDLVASPGLEPGLSALRGRRVNQLHHDAKQKRNLFAAIL